MVLSNKTERHNAEFEEGKRERERARQRGRERKVEGESERTLQDVDFIPF